MSTDAEPAAATALLRLLEVMRRLRDPRTGCPWDLEQSFATIAPYTIEEAYEVADAIARDDPDGLRDELGDLLLQVVYHARIAEEGGAFDFAAVARGIADKMVARHPHVFGVAEVASAASQSQAWEAHKENERRVRAARLGRQASALDDVPLALPALARAAKLQRRAARVGFDWPEPVQVLDKIAEEVEEIRAELRRGDRAATGAEIGDLLFAAVNLARHCDVDPEETLRSANRKFEKRFRRVEELLVQQGKTAADVSLAEMEAHWVRAKLDERG